MKAKLDLPGKKIVLNGGNTNVIARERIRAQRVVKE